MRGVMRFVMKIGLALVALTALGPDAMANRARLCEILLNSAEPVHVFGPRTANDWLTPQAEGTLVPPVAEYLATYTPRDLVEVAQDETAARALLERHEPPPRRHAKNLTRLRRDAAILLSRRLTPNLVPGFPLTRRQFYAQATLLSAVETLGPAYRFDARTPDVITKVGFWPNPERRPTTMWEGCHPRVLGGSNVVSLTTDRSHAPAARGLPAVADTGDETLTECAEKTAQILRRTTEILRGVRPELDPTEFEMTLGRMLATHYLVREALLPGHIRVHVRRGHQYQITNARGARVPPEYGQYVEREFMTRSVRSARVQPLGEVIYVALYIRGRLRGLDPRSDCDLLEFIVDELGHVHPFVDEGLPLANAPKTDESSACSKP